MFDKFIRHFDVVYNTEQQQQQQLYYRGVFAEEINPANRERTSLQGEVRDRE